jgi:hypothetical protein
MTESDYARKLDEVDALVNDPSRRLDADKVWSLLAEIARHHAATESDAA